jgi:hypothetical protein
MSQGELTHYLARLFEPRVGPSGATCWPPAEPVLGAATYDSGHGHENDIPWGWARLVRAGRAAPRPGAWGVGRFLLAACAAHARAQGAWAFFVRAPSSWSGGGAWPRG